MKASQNEIGFDLRLRQMKQRFPHNCLEEKLEVGCRQNAIRHPSKILENEITEDHKGMKDIFKRLLSGKSKHWTVSCGSHGVSNLPQQEWHLLSQTACWLLAD
jgi:hypothetical protein